MAHNFRILDSSFAYVSKAGSASNNGTPDAPFAHPFSVVKNTSVIGAGAYVLTDTQNYASENINWRADGRVKMLGNHTDVQQLALYYTNAQDVYFDQFAGIQWSIYNNAPHFLTRCIIKLIANLAENNIRHGVEAYYNDCILYNYNCDGQSATQFNHCIFINCKIRSSGGVNNCYIDATSSIVTNSGTNNNIDPGCSAASSQGLNINGAGWVVPAGNISQPPLFNSVQNEEFTLRVSSPHLPRAIGPTHLRYAQVWLLRSTAAAGQPATTANTWLENTADSSRVSLLTCDNFNWSAAGSLYIAENQSSGFAATYRTDSLVFAATAQELVSLPMISGLNFNTDFPGTEAQFNSNSPEVFNNNVPRVNTYASGGAGRNPARLTIRARFSTRTAPRSNVNADWFPSDGTWLEMELGTKPLWNQATNTGNGSPDFIASQAQTVIATAMQLEYVAANNYYSH